MNGSLQKGLRSFDLDHRNDWDLLVERERHPEHDLRGRKIAQLVII